MEISGAKMSRIFWPTLIKKSVATSDVNNQIRFIKNKNTSLDTNGTPIVYTTNTLYKKGKWEDKGSSPLSDLKKIVVEIKGD